MDEPSWIYYDNESFTDAEPHKVRKSHFLVRTGLTTWLEKRSGRVMPGKKGW